MRIPRVQSFSFLLAIIILVPCASFASNTSPEVPVVDGGIGPCRADFTVKDEAGKPIYDAKIKVTLRYGIFNKRKMDLEIGTNSDGKARIIGLPDSPKKPLEFQIKSGTVSKSVEDDPSANCTAVYEVTLSVHEALDSWRLFIYVPAAVNILAASSVLSPEVRNDSKGDLKIHDALNDSFPAFVHRGGGSNSDTRNRRPAWPAAHLSHHRHWAVQLLALA